MFIALEARTPCHMCGYQLRKIWTGYARINKRSMRFRGGLGAVDRTCPECLTPATGDAATLFPGAFRPTANSATEIREYRLRRWPELAKEAP